MGGTTVQSSLKFRHRCEGVPKEDIARPGCELRRGRERLPSSLDSERDGWRNAF